MSWRWRVGAASSLRVAAKVDEDPALLLRDTPPFLCLVHVALARARDEADDGVKVALLDEVAEREPCVQLSIAGRRRSS
jgi:hypothetical protein